MNFSNIEVMLHERQKVCQIILTRFTIPRVVLVDEFDVAPPRGTKAFDIKTFRGNFDRYGLLQSRHPLQPSFFWPGHSVDRPKVSADLQLISSGDE